MKAKLNSPCRSVRLNWRAARNVIFAALLLPFGAAHAQTWFSLQEGDVRSGSDPATVNTAGTLVTAGYNTGCTYIRGYTNANNILNGDTNLIMGNINSDATVNVDSSRVLVAFDLTPLANYVGSYAYTVNGVNLITTHQAAGAGSGSTMALVNTTPFNEATATWNNPGAGAPAGGTLGTVLATKSIIGTTTYPATETWVAAGLTTAIQTALANPTNKTGYFLFKRNTETDANFIGRYVTDENTDPAYGGIDSRPELQVSITILSNAPLVSVSAVDADASEPGSNTGMFTITRSVTITNDLTVFFSYGGAAVQGTDYTASESGSVTLPAGVTSTNILITPLDDASPEDNEAVSLNLTSNPAYGVGVGSAVVTIADDNDGGSLVQYFFGNTFAPQIWSTNITATTLTTPGLSAAFSSVSLTPPGAFYAQDTLTSASETQAIADGDYLSAVITPNFGYVLTLTNLELSDIYYNSTSVEASNAVLFIRSSLDNFATTIGALTNVAFNYGGGWSTLSVPLGTTFSNRVGSVEFRFYIYDDGVGGDAGLRVDNLYMRGEATPLAAGAQQVALTVSDANAAEPSDPGTFTITRAGSTAAPLTVNYAVSGTASNGVDYSTLIGIVVIPANTNSVTLTVAPIDDLQDEGAETVIVTLQGSPNYGIYGASAATVTIADNSEPTQISVAATDNNAYERVATLAGQFTITRSGDKSGSTTAHFVLSGFAVSGVDYISSATNTVSFAPGEATKTITITPIDNATVNGTREVDLALQPSGGYLLLAATNAAVFIYDDEFAAATVLFSDQFETASSATNYIVLEAQRDGGAPDSTVDYSFDYSTIGVPPPPGSVTTRGLKVTVNKTGTNLAAAINFFPKNIIASNNYALRFNVFAQWDPTANFVEFMLAGINHSATATNWSYSTTSSTPNFGDGQFVGLSNTETDPMTTLFTTANTGSAPVRIAINRPNLTANFNNPPYGAPAGLPGVIACANTSATKTWVDCELSQMDGIVRFKANGATLFTYTNNSAFTNGHVMIGYMDSFDSVGPVDSFAIFDNVRVVALPSATAPVITHIAVNGGTVQISFSGATSDTPAGFKLQSSATVNGIYTDDNSALITGSGANLQAATAVNGSMHFYRIRRN